MKNIEIFNTYTKLTKFGQCTTAYSVTVNAAKTKNLRILKPYVEEFLKLRNEIIDKNNNSLAPNVEEREKPLNKLCEKEIIELSNIDFPEVDQMLSKVELSVLPQDIPPSEYSLLEDIIIL